MSKHLPYRFTRILVRKDGVWTWYGATMCVKHEGLPQQGEISVREFEKRRLAAVQLYGKSNVEHPVLAGNARTWEEAEKIFNEMQHETIDVSW